MELKKRVEQATQAIRNHFGSDPVKRAVVLGSGMSSAVEEFAVNKELAYEKIEGFPRPSVEGHPGRLSLCTLGNRGKPFFVLQGRVHFYEGLTLKEITIPVRVMAALGVKTLVVTNAAGSVDPGFKTGNLMVIRDHINFMGASPLRGTEIAGLGKRFVDMTAAYDPDLVRLALAKGKNVQSGVYAALRGPQYETPAEVKMLRALGVDAVGMSTVPEVIVARQLEMKVLGISLVTNMASGIGAEGPDHGKVAQVADQGSARLGQLIAGVLSDVE